MIGIGGLARAGKDTLALNLKQIIEEDMGVEVKIYSFARAIRDGLDDLLTENLGISAFTDDTAEKVIIRPIMVAFGESMKARHGDNVWSDIVFEQIKKDKCFPIIPDVRFDFEVSRIQGTNGQVIHLLRNGNEVPPNQTEALNDPKVARLADLNHTWPNYKKGQLDECQSHAHILWQMLKETQGDQWKTMYS